jgi:hypothetical protein
VENVPNDVQPEEFPRASAYMRGQAVRALNHFGAKDRGKAELLLPMWAHYDMLSAKDREIVLDTFGGPPLTTDIPCPPWCVVDHAEIYEDFTRSCTSESWLTMSVDTDGEPARELSVEACRHIDLEAQAVGPMLVAVGDEYLPPQDARDLADAIVRAADTAEGLND